MGMGIILMERVKHNLSIPMLFSLFTIPGRERKKDKIRGINHLSSATGKISVSREKMMF